ncbi:MAG: UDP-N-acetylmuramoyl-L-alanine--D-glutamate ligase [Anaplasmataceae bacterium]|nr:UDP-N-acetylmuramoyl-L-alanine--D-glutamate ligase [Anaplasmataceae bacterium]
MKIAIVGFSREGQAVFKFLKKHGTDGQKLSPKSEIWILDQNPNLKTPKGTPHLLGKDYLATINSFDLVFRSPGIPYLLPELVKARKNGVRFSSATKLFFWHCPGTIIGITGTKGKGTTSTLLYKMLKNADQESFLVGNIGTNDWLNLLPKISKKSKVIFELSSFQLQDLAQSPHISIVLDVDSDHLDHHRSLKEYQESKASIARYQNKNDYVLYWPENKVAKKIASTSPGKKIPLSIKEFTLFSKEDLYVPAPHQFKNAIAASQAAAILGTPNKIIKKTVKEFRGLKYRLELVTKKTGVSYYNDSAATNPHSTSAAVKSFPSPLILIAGGKSKGISYGNLGKTIDHSTAKLVILIGENKGEIKKTIKKKPTLFAKSLKEAIFQAKKNAKPGEIILFSPASASFDMFKNYEERGRIFSTLIKKG